MGTETAIRAAAGAAAPVPGVLDTFQKGLSIASGVLNPGDATPEEQKMGKFFSDAVLSGKMDAADIQRLQAQINKLDEGFESLDVAMVVSAAEELKQFLQQNEQSIFGVGLTEEGATINERVARLAKYKEDETSRYNIMMATARQPMEWMTTVASLGGAIGMLIKMGVDAGIVPPQYGALADQLIEKAEGWDEKVRNDMPYEVSEDVYDRQSGTKLSTVFDPSNLRTDLHGSVASQGKVIQDITDWGRTQLYRSEEQLGRSIAPTPEPVR